MGVIFEINLILNLSNYTSTPILSYLNSPNFVNVLYLHFAHAFSPEFKVKL